jgi:hypothetical protein
LLPRGLFRIPPPPLPPMASGGKLAVSPSCSVRSTCPLWLYTLHSVTVSPAQYTFGHPLLFAECDHQIPQPAFCSFFQVEIWLFSRLRLFWIFFLCHQNILKYILASTGSIITNVFIEFNVGGKSDGLKMTFGTWKGHPHKIKFGKLANYMYRGMPITVGRFWWKNILKTVPLESINFYVKVTKTAKNVTMR